MMVNKSLLCKVEDSVFEAMFSGRHVINKKDGIYFLDRDPEIFTLLISYMRNDFQVLPTENETLKKLLHAEL